MFIVTFSCFSSSSFFLSFFFLLLSFVNYTLAHTRILAHTRNSSTHSTEKLWIFSFIILLLLCGFQRKKKKLNKKHTQKNLRAWCFVSQQSICCVTRVRLNEFCPKMKIYIGESATTLPASNKNSTRVSRSDCIRVRFGVVVTKIQSSPCEWGNFVYDVWLEHRIG